MRYPQVRYPIIRHYERYNYSECIGHKWGEPTHYNAALSPPRYPMPAIPLEVKYDYVGCVNIDDVSDPDDPIIVYMFDSWTGQNV